jgi:hypothetical protein
MKITTLADQVLAGVRVKTNNRSLTLDDVVGWHTQALEPEPGREVVHLKTQGLYVVIKCQ